MQHLGVCAILLDQTGQVLLGERKNSYKAGYLGLPGGRIELNEPLEIAITREVEEETGFTDLSFTYLGVVRENQETYDFIHFVYMAQVGLLQPELREPDKCAGWQWLNADPANSHILPGHAGALRLWKEHLTLLDLTQ